MLWYIIAIGLVIMFFGSILDDKKYKCSSCGSHNVKDLGLDGGGPGNSREIEYHVYRCKSCGQIDEIPTGRRWSKGN